MDKKYLALTFVSIGLFSSVYFYMDKNNNINIKNNDSVQVEKTQEIQKEKVKKNIEILYLKEKKEDISENIKNSETLQKVTQKNDYIENTIKGYTKESEIKNYINSNNLKKITINKQKQNTPKPRFQVYSNITMEEAKKKKDQFSPPMTPVIISGHTVNGDAYTVAIDADVYKHSSKIAIADTIDDEQNSIDNITEVPSTNEMEEETTNKEVEVLAPPQIGVNN